MKIYRLRSYDLALPGNYPYDQPGPKPRKFPAQPMIEAQARTVLAYRKGNNLERATYAECLVDVDRFQAVRLGNNPMYFVPINVDAPETMAIAPDAPGLAPCKGCGMRVN